MTSYLRFTHEYRIKLDIRCCVDIISDTFNFDTSRTFQSEEINHFGELASVARLFAQFYAGTRKFLYSLANSY